MKSKITDVLDIVRGWKIPYDNTLSIAEDKDLIKAYNQALVDDINLGKDVEKRKGYIHPSSIYNPCDRAILLEAYGLRDKFKVSDAGMLDNFNLGKIIHKHCQSYIKKIFDIDSKFFAIEDVPISYKPLSIAGELDMLIPKGAVIKHTGKVLKSWLVVEIKSIAEEYFRKLNEPLFQHILQVHAYYLLGDLALYEKYGIRLKSAYILYCCKDKRFSKKGFFVGRSKYLVDEIKYRVERLSDMFSKSILPSKVLPEVCNKRCFSYKVCQEFPPGECLLKE